MSSPRARSPYPDPRRTPPDPPTELAGHRVLRRFARTRRGELWLAVGEPVEPVDPAGDDGERSAEDPGVQVDPVVIRRSNVDDPLLGREIAIAALQLPHTLQVLDVSSDGMQTMLVLELLGPTLAELLARRDALDAGEVVTLVAPVAQTISRLHALGWSHGRLDPAHLRLREDGAPVILGWGGARAHPAGVPEIVLETSSGVVADREQLRAMAMTLLARVGGRRAAQARTVAAQIAEVPGEHLAAWLGDELFELAAGSPVRWDQPVPVASSADGADGVESSLERGELPPGGDPRRGSARAIPPSAPAATDVPRIESDLTSTRSPATSLPPSRPVTSPVSGHPGASPTWSDEVPSAPRRTPAPWAARLAALVPEFDPRHLEVIADDGPATAARRLGARAKGWLDALPAGRRRAVLAGVAATLVLVVGFLAMPAPSGVEGSLTPDAAAAERSGPVSDADAREETDATEVEAEAETSAQTGTQAASPRSDGGDSADTDRSDDADLSGDDPVRALDALLARRQECLDAASVTCLDEVSRPGTSANDTDRAAALAAQEGEEPAPLRLGADARVTEQLGDAVLVDLDLGRRAEIRSVMLVRDPGGRWWVRAYLAG